uniref:EamA domain-containing protein n=1 Tax=Haptolina ericina TaxID=156174 RepID=A0A7S3B5C9_9EUKA
MEVLDDDEAALPLTIWQLVAMLVATSAWFAQGALTGGPGGSGVGEWLASLQTLNGAEPTLLPAIAWMGLVSGAAVLWGETIILREVPSTEAGVIFATEPVWAAAFAALLLHDAISPNEIAGGGAIVLGCLALQLPADVVLRLVGRGTAAADAAAVDAADPSEPKLPM